MSRIAHCWLPVFALLSCEGPQTVAYQNQHLTRSDANSSEVASLTFTGAEAVLQSADGRVRIHLPARQTSGPVEIRLRRATELPMPPAGWRLVGPLYQLESDAELNPSELRLSAAPVAIAPDSPIPEDAELLIAKHGWESLATTRESTWLVNSAPPSNVGATVLALGIPLPADEQQCGSVATAALSSIEEACPPARLHRARLKLVTLCDRGQFGEAAAASLQGCIASPRCEELSTQIDRCLEATP